MSLKIYIYIILKIYITKFLEILPQKSLIVEIIYITVAIFSHGGHPHSHNPGHKMTIRHLVFSQEKI